MSQKNPSVDYWKETLKMPADWAKSVDDFETEIALKKQNKIDDKVFAETRLRKGAYGQRYDNGKRHDGRADRPIPFPRALTKGPNTIWDAPGMQRIKIPYGGMTLEQMDVLADLGEEYSDSIVHITTRQDIQLHYVHIEDTPSMFRRLAAVGITTHEACGNSVRNVTGCPIAGVCHDEAFDTSPHADAMFRYFLGHPDIQDFGRKFKISFSGCKSNPCALARIHDLGLISVKKVVDGVEKRGFEYYVGGGLGAVPYQAKLFDDFITEEELFPLTQAMFRIYSRYGEKKNRNRARIKFLVGDWGIEKFRQMVLEERAKLTFDPQWVDWIPKVEQYKEEPLHAAQIKEIAKDNSPFTLWLQHNVKAQKQSGYHTVTVALPLGDITSNQLRDLVTICRKYIKDTVRTTVEQNIVLRWVASQDLESLYKDLLAIDLAAPHAATIVDITSCPGTDTCKLGVSASRGLAGELRERLAAKNYELDEVIRGLRIKISGCFNSCGQHHLSDMGFYGISRKVGNHIVPHFQLVLGGQWSENGGAYGLPVVAIPSKAIPATVERLSDLYLKNRQGQESFQEFIKRTGKLELKKLLLDLTVVPPYETDKSFYMDWGSVRTFTTSDIGVGECAGEVVSLVEFGLKQADREVFEAQIQLENGKTEEAAKTAFMSMIHAAQGLLKDKNPDMTDEVNAVLSEFNAKFCETKLFHDPFAGDKFASIIFKTAEKGHSNLTKEQIDHRIQEAQLFVDAAHSCYARMSMTAPLPL